MTRTRLIRSFLLRISQINNHLEVTVQDIRTGKITGFEKLEDAWQFIEAKHEANKHIISESGPSAKERA